MVGRRSGGAGFKRAESLPKRVFEGRTGRGEKFGTGLLYVQIVLEADPELTADINTRFVAEDHSGLQCRLLRPPVHVAFYQVAPFVHLHAEPVADPVSEVLESRTVTAIYDDPPSGCVDNLIRYARFCRFERRLLRAPHNLEDPEHLVRRFAQDKRPGDVGSVALDSASIVEHDD